MDFKLIGCILLIVGTSIGAGMLALPIATAHCGFIGSLILLLGCWVVMTSCAFLILEVNLWLPHNNNLISMAKATIGPFGQMITWVFYLLLLYSLLCAYIAGGSDLFHNLLVASGVDVPVWVSAFLFTFIFGAIVYTGIKYVDYTNRALMSVKLIAYILLVIFLMPFISTEKLLSGDITKLTSIGALTVTITSFGYANIVPSLRIYFAGDLHKLKIAIIVGSLIPLVCYALWDAVIMGVIPLEGENGLISILNSNSSTSNLVNVLTSTAASNTITFAVKLFTSICVLTSFLSMSLSLGDFLADGLQIEKIGKNKILILLLTFIPPLLIVLFFPGMFIKALEYAGIYCIILLILLPAVMAWRGRYIKNIAHGYRFKGGKVLLTVLILFSVITLGQSIISIFL